MIRTDNELGLSPLAPLITNATSVNVGDLNFIRLEWFDGSISHIARTEDSAFEAYYSIDGRVIVFERTEAGTQAYQSPIVKRRFT